ncbi:serine/threonine-protein kinase [Streptomyces microflavus]|uniref:serine/threonine-protein kinase n=1 Tax=Streptomyces microflavus TaxID=1919 RepID=UPI0037F4652D
MDAVLHSSGRVHPRRLGDFLRTERHDHYGAQDEWGCVMQYAQDLLARYGQWRGDEELSDDVRAEQLTAIVTTLLQQSVPSGSIERYDHADGPGLIYQFEGCNYRLRLDETAEGMYLGDTRKRRNFGGISGSEWSSLVWTTESVGEALVAEIQAFGGAVLDRKHLEAAVAGMRPLAELIRDHFSRRQANLPLLALLNGDDRPPEEWTMAPAARLVSPPSVETQTWQGVTAELLLVGHLDSRDRPTGMALLTDRTALVTCPDGLLAVDTVLGRTHWHLPLPGCHGASVVQEDKAVLVLCGSTLVRWHDRQLTAVAGGFDEGAVLLLGPEGEPWVLSGSGVTFGTGQRSLTLTRAGVQAGDQVSYPLTFEASVRSALWLDRRRFFLAASGHSAVVDLARTTDAGKREDWIRTPVSYPGHTLRAGVDDVISASPDGSGIGVGVHRTDITTRTSEPLLHAQLGDILGLAQEPGRGPAFLLAALPDNDHTRLRPVLMRISGHRASPPKASAAPVGPAVGYEAVSESARGQRSDYRLDRLPLAREGQAEVFRAEHKATGTVVAFKRRTGRGERDARRMRREVAAALRFGTNPHVMPVLDFSPAHDWFVMPLAEATVEDRRMELHAPAQLHTLVCALAAGLADAHRNDWIHRDIKPSNILLLEGRWTVADWGIVRRPRGETSTAGLLTRAGIGTEGFAAPELSVDGHDITPASDVYSLGQLIGWIFAGTWPQANVPLLPPPGPWYGVVRRATQLDPAQRPQDIDAFLTLVERETGSQDELAAIRAIRLLDDANERRDTAAASQLLELAADQPNSYELYLAAVAKLNVADAEPALLANPQQTTTVLQALAAHSVGDRGDWPTPEEADQAIRWLLNVAGIAAQNEKWGMLDAAVRGIGDWDGRWDRWGPRNSIRDWLRALTGQAAAVVASALRAQPHGARHHHDLVDDRRVDMAIRSAVHAALRT